MKQFTVYARDGETGESGPVYVITCAAGKVVACALRQGWEAAAQRMEDGLNMMGVRPVGIVRHADAIAAPVPVGNGAR